MLEQPFLRQKRLMLTLTSKIFSLVVQPRCEVWLRQCELRTMTWL
jgi:hypothetical protein